MCSMNASMSRFVSSPGARRRPAQSRKSISSQGCCRVDPMGRDGLVLRAQRTHPVPFQGLQRRSHSPKVGSERLPSPERTSTQTCRSEGQVGAAGSNLRPPACKQLCRLRCADLRFYPESATEKSKVTGCLMAPTVGSSEGTVSGRIAEWPWIRAFDAGAACRMFSPPRTSIAAPSHLWLRGAGGQDLADRSALARIRPTAPSTARLPRGVASRCHVPNSVAPEQRLEA